MAKRDRCITNLLRDQGRGPLSADEGVFEAASASQPVSTITRSQGIEGFINEIVQLRIGR